MLEFESYDSIEDPRKEVQVCSQDGHTQQVAYSTWHDGITQVCFYCGKVRTSTKEVQRSG